jgi:very-short-patch-repair endonuclease
MKKLTCRLCGKEFGQLIKHLNCKHNISGDEYKKRFNEPVAVFDEEERKAISLRVRALYNDPIFKAKHKKSRNSIWSKKYWINKGFTEEEAKEKISELQSANSKKVPHRPEDQCFNKLFWIKRGFSEEEAIQIVHEIQVKNSSKASKFKNHHHTAETKTQVSCSMSKHIQESGSKEWVAHFGPGGSTSKSEIRLYEFIKTNLFSEAESSASVGRYIVDIKCKNKIIEYFGEFWHMDPRRYPDDFINPKTHQSAKEKHLDDESRINKLESLGYEILIIWELDYHNDYDGCIEQIKLFLNDIT